MAKVFTVPEVAMHNKKEDLFMIIHGKVYDCTDFADKHPAGHEILLEVAGKEASEAFEEVGHSEDAKAMLKDLFVGDCIPPISLTVKRASHGSNLARLRKEIWLGVFPVVVLGVIGGLYAHRLFGNDHVSRT
ncbi:uncharacterized protein PV06_11276 [Exophiala oligosperma]|uniref:Cytochrome b5 heme-binding domain-containing protein n=1 Tax=Exophiala oligosperma TaxID=215243 RepID=A0A0D2D2K6_9EURO|nr:uncharacterized protein PV06_11276 [Exophiala oligosperma]KIW36460.1 hypothetical protein PV06_11276 [Exophiala oligosperma]